MVATKNIPEQADVVIVGAGAAGLYCAWRLLKQDPARTIAIFDRLNRTGGRLDTDLIKIEDTGDKGSVIVRDEEGGMRFTYEMKELMSLFHALRLCDQTVYFPMTTNRYSIRGHSFTYCETAEDDNAIWGELYDLDPTEEGQSPGALITTVYDRIVMENTGKAPPPDPTPEYWQRVRNKFTWKGIPLNQWTMWGLLRDMGYSEECVTMFTHTIGFEGPFLSLVNAGEAWQILEDFPMNPHYWTFKYGYSTLIKALQSEIEAMAGDIIHLGANVDSMVSAAGGYDVQLSLAEPGDSAYPFEAGLRKHTICGSQVILAVPSEAMKTLFLTSPVLNQAANARQIYDDIRSVLGMGLMKINLYYEDPWWENGLTGQEPVKGGPSFTDLPINAVYPFYPLDGISATSPAALTIYCDFNNINFWNGLQNVGPKFSSPLQQEHSQPPQVIFPASDAVVDEATRQFKQLFKSHYVPEPVMTSYRSWTNQDDFGFGYHQWALNVDDREVIQRMVQPVPDEQIYTCNEAWSDQQGWVNGSLRSSDLVLTQIYGLEKIDETYDSCEAKTPPADPTCVDGQYVYPDDSERPPIEGGKRWKTCSSPRRH